MPDYTFRRASKELFAVYHAIYQDANIDMSFDWNERLRELRSNDHCFFLYEGEKTIGGFTINGNHISSPFLIEPFCDRALFWQQTFAHVEAESNETEIYLHRIPKKDVETLTVLGATTKFSEQRMCRPTDIFDSPRRDDVIFVIPNVIDISEIIQVVYQAHVDGYTATVRGKPNITDIEEAIHRRFHLFAKTNTLHLGAIAKRTDTKEIIGVCIAGIYPDSPNCFATIHQVSVLPQYRGKGLAKAMMLRTISTAHLVAPVITLQVLIGNPAEYLYRKLGFVAGPSFTDMAYTLLSEANTKNSLPEFSH